MIFFSLGVHILRFCKLSKMLCSRKTVAWRQHLKYLFDSWFWFLKRRVLLHWMQPNPTLCRVLYLKNRAKPLKLFISGVFDQNNNFWMLVLIFFKWYSAKSLSFFPCIQCVMAILWDIKKNYWKICLTFYAFDNWRSKFK